MLDRVVNIKFLVGVIILAITAIVGLLGLTFLEWGILQFEYSCAFGIAVAIYTMV